MALQGHPRSLILAPIKSAYATSYWSSIVTLVLSCPVSEVLQISSEERHHHYFTRILGVFPLTSLPMLWLRGAKNKLIIRVITFELTQHTRAGYHNVTDGRMTYDSNTALALRASRVGL